MIRQFVWISVLMLGFVINGFGQGINFETCSFEQALQKAKTEQKLVFIDCYTSWCGPCRLMTRDVFPQQAVGDYMNKEFVNLKIDVEKGEGIELAKRFRVTVYPTFLVIDPNGSLVHKFVGASGPQTFIARVKESFDSEKAFAALEKRYEDGDRDKKFLTDYVDALRACSDPKVHEVLNELFTRLDREERLSERYRFIFEQVDYFPVGSEAWKFFVDERDAFEQILKPEGVNRLLYFGYQSVLFGIFDGRPNWPMRKLKWLDKEVDRTPFDPELMNTIHSLIRIAMAMHKGIDQVLNVCEQEFPTIPPGVFSAYSLSELYEPQMNQEQKERWEHIKGLLRTNHN